MPKVVLIHYEKYDADKLAVMINNGIDLLGGINKFIKKGEKILIKPNLLFGKSPEKGISTNPAVFEAVTKILKEAGVRIIYGDSPGMGNPFQVAKKCGLEQVARKYNISFCDFNSGIDKNIVIEGKKFDFKIAKEALDADGIINLPKMKTHQFLRITGCVKNMLGCIAGGLNKSTFHVKYPYPYDFSRMLVGLYMLLKPRLNIMDGIVAMEGNGPSSGNLVKMNCILISDDPVALDSTFCRMIDLNPEFIPTNVIGERLMLGSYKNVELLGDDIGKFINKKFNVIRIPLNEMSTDKSEVHPVLSKLMPKPVIIKKKCTRCGICIKSCPVTGKALNFINSKNPPVYDYTKCIRCFCCQEMCPNEAIIIKNNILYKLLFK